MKEIKEVRKRQTQSCDRCKNKKRKCDGKVPCENCIKAEAECKTEIIQKKRGPKRNGEHSHSEEGDHKRSKQLDSSDQNIQITSNQTSLTTSQKDESNLDFLNESTRVLDFDADFAFNFGLESLTNYPQVDIPLDQMKPSAFNQPSMYTTSQPLSIDPEVLNLYTQLNPKLSVQSDLDLFLSTTLGTNAVPSDDSFLYDATNLSVPELPGIPTTFYMHLISMFFTYYHGTMPIIQESVFLENLVPTNRLHPMLLNTIYAIGCHYSRSPYLYQSPFYTPQKAVDYFIARALSATPPPETWGLMNSNSISIAQASLLLSSCDFQLKKSHTWMMSGMGIRLNQKFEMFAEQASHNFLSICNSITKFHVNCTLEERKRVWWCAMLSDLFLSLSNGTPLLINEAEHVEALISPRSSVSPAQPFSLAQSGINPIAFQGNTRINQNGSDADKWMPYFSGFPKDTIFGASDVNSEMWGRQSVGFFQVGHLYSNLDSMLHIMQLSFLTRRAMRLMSKPAPPPNQMTVAVSCLYSLLPDSTNELGRIHDALIRWYESLPSDIRMWESLEVLVSDNYSDLTSYCTLKEGKRLSSTAVLLNMLFFATVSILHQKSASAGTDVNHYFKISTSLIYNRTFTSLDLLRYAYRGQVYLLRRIYGQSCPPQQTTIPPSEIVGSSMISCLMMPTAVALLAQDTFADKMLEKFNPNTFVPIHEQQDPSGIDPLEAVILPVLINIGQVWPISLHYANAMREIMNGVKNKIDKSGPIHQMWQQYSNGGATQANGQTSQRMLQPNQIVNTNYGENGSNGQRPVQKPTTPSMISPNPLLSAFADPPAQQSWNDIRKEFEDEFLL